MCVTWRPVAPGRMTTRLTTRVRRTPCHAALSCPGRQVTEMGHMDTARATELLKRLGPSVAFVEVENADGDVAMGSAFHVGDGVFVTASHVLRDMRVLSVATTTTGYVPYREGHGEPPRTMLHDGDKARPVHHVRPRPLVIDRGPYHHPDPRVDLAVFGVEAVDEHQPVLRLGDHLDDWLGDIDFVLSGVVLLGYPAIPMTERPSLFAVRAEVNAVIDRYDAPYVHFIVGSLPRGGFSGGPAVSEFGQVLGVIVQSLLRDGGPPESGYVTVLGVEAIYGLLADHRMLPPEQSEGWDGFWNHQEAAYGEVGEDPTGLADRVFTSHAEVGVFDDGYALEVYYRDNTGDWAETFEAVLRESVRLHGFAITADDNRYRRFRAPVPVDRAILLEVYAAANRMVECLEDAELQWTGFGPERRFTAPAE